jgi:hypothetical protein
MTGTALGELPLVMAAERRILDRAGRLLEVAAAAVGLHGAAPEPRITWVSHLSIMDAVGQPFIENGPHLDSPPIIDRIRSVTTFNSASISARSRGGLNT